MTISNGRLTIELTLPAGLLRVEDRESGLVWRQSPPTRRARGADWGRVSLFDLPAARQLRIDGAQLAGRTISAQASWLGHPFDLSFALDEREPVLSVTIDSADRERPLPWKPGWAGVMLMTYPYAFYHPQAGLEMAVPVDEGVLYSTRELDITRDPRRWRPWWLHQKLSMPWWGITDGERGVMTRVETPFDCFFSIDQLATPDGEFALPQVTWIGSKGALAYPRQVVFEFFAAGGYVAIAKSFRRHIQEAGQFVSWAEKVRDNPAVARLRGALDLWYDGRVDADTIRRLRQAGIRRAIVARVGRGDPAPDEGIDPSAAKAADEAGYLLGRYHNDSWIQSRWVAADPSLRDLAVLPADGKLKYRPSPWDPKGNLFRCPVVLDRIFAQQTEAERRFGLTYFFADTTATGGSVLECHNPDHPARRAEAAAALRAALRIPTAWDMVVGSERGKWWATPTTHVFEGIETLLEYAGRYYGAGGESHWVGPYLREKPGFAELFLGYDFNPARRVPLFQLVYHDSVYCTRRWNQDPGRDPELWDRHDLMNILSGTPPLIFMRPSAGNVIGTDSWERVGKRYLATYRNVGGWHEQIGFEEMTDHRFLSDDRLVQETRYGNGQGVVVNFGDTTWEDPRGFTVPPYAEHRLDG